MSSNPLTKEQIADLHEGSIANRRAIQSAIKYQNRAINTAIKKHRPAIEIDSAIKVFASLYIFEAEALLLELITYPGALTAQDIQNILEQPTLEKKWETAIEVATGNMNIQNKKRAAQVRGDFKALFESHVKNQIPIRNKLCHGQFNVAFSHTWKRNSTLTSKLNSLDCEAIKTDIMVIERMSHTLGELIKSPHYAHPRDYENEINSLLDLINELSSHTMDKKRALLDRKRK